MTEFLEKHVSTIRAGVDDHNGRCCVPARAILLHPTEHEKLGVSKLWGLDVTSDERQRSGYFRVACEGSAWRVEDEILAFIATPAAVPDPATAPVPAERPLAAAPKSSSNEQGSL